jgi:hypothetical protein
LATSSLVAPLAGGLIQPQNLNVTQTGSRLLTATLIGQLAGSNPWIQTTAQTIVVTTAANAGIAGGLIWNFQSVAGTTGVTTFTIGPPIPIDTVRGYVGRVWAAQVSTGAPALSVGIQAFSDVGASLGTVFFIASGVAPGTAGANYFSSITGTGGGVFPANTVYVQLVIQIAADSTPWQCSFTVPELWEGLGFDNNDNNYLPLGTGKSFGIYSAGSSVFQVKAAGGVYGSAHGPSGTHVVVSTGTTTYTLISATIAAPAVYLVYDSQGGAAIVTVVGTTVLIISGSSYYVVSGAASGKLNIEVASSALSVQTNSGGLPTGFVSGTSWVASVPLGV